MEKLGLYERKIWKMIKWFKKRFCKCNKTVRIISSRDSVIQFGKCDVCGKYWFSNLQINKMLPLKENEYISLKNELERFEKELKELGYND